MNGRIHSVLTCFVITATATLVFESNSPLFYDLLEPIPIFHFRDTNGRGWMKSSPQYHHRRKIRITSQKYLKSE